MSDFFCLRVPILSHLLVVTGKCRYLVVGDPNVVLDDAAVPRAGAQYVSLPGKRPHARRVPRHRSQLIRCTHTKRIEIDRNDAASLLLVCSHPSRWPSSEADQAHIHTQKRIETQDPSYIYVARKSRWLNSRTLIIFFLKPQQTPRKIAKECVKRIGKQDRCYLYAASKSRWLQGYW